MLTNSLSHYQAVAAIQRAVQRTGVDAKINYLGPIVDISLAGWPTEYMGLAIDLAEEIDAVQDPKQFLAAVEHTMRARQSLEVK